MFLNRDDGRKETSIVAERKLLLGSTAIVTGAAQGIGGEAIVLQVDVTRPREVNEMVPPGKK